MSPGQNRTGALSIIVAYHKQWEFQVTILKERFDKELGFLYKVILNNQSDEKRDIRFVYHQHNLASLTRQVSFVSPSKQTILHYGKPYLSLLASRFHNEINCQLAVGKKEKVWCDQEGTLVLAPLCTDGQESMIVSRIQMNPSQETYGRIWEVFGQTEEEVYIKHYKQVTFDKLNQATKQTL
ncbi:hypothetical protein [Halalkalibacter lacteus]|uniref:hypothetical protein n=1 Tax=Halalkalibacter lacteus TaxID=3090663 RepID=UPI002FC74679